MKKKVLITLFCLPLYANSAQTANDSKKMSSPVSASAFHLLPTLEMNIKGWNNAPVKAVQDGIVEATEKKVGARKNIIVIRHSGNIISIYANLEKMQVKPGERVSKETVIGYLGSQSNSDLHFEVRKDGSNVNPIDFISFEG